MVIVNVSTENKQFVQPFLRSLEPSLSPLAVYQLEDPYKVVVYGKPKLVSKIIRKKIKDSYRRVKANVSFRQKSELDRFFDDLKIN